MKNFQAKIQSNKLAEANLTPEELLKKLNTQRRISGALTLALGLLIIFR